MTGHAMTALGGTGLPALSLWGAFVLGLLGSATHCAAMCGPLVAATGLASGATKSAAGDVAGPAWRFHAGFHAGRLLMYSAIGAVLGLFAENDVLDALAGPAGSERLAAWLRGGAGITMVAVGVMLIVAPLLGRDPRLPEPTAVLARSRLFGRAVATLARSRVAWGLPLGAAMGLLPCAPLLPVELAALGSGSPLGGALTMLSFGVGTLPLLGGFGALAEVLGLRARSALLTASGVAVVLLGAYTVAQAATLPR